jgi:hypothetical protein
MAKLTDQEIEQLKEQLAQKTQEIKDIHNKLMEAGVIPFSDDFLDTVSGGLIGPHGTGTPPPTPTPTSTSDPYPER